MPDYSKIEMFRIDPETGQEVAVDDADKRRLVDAMCEAIHKGQVIYSPQAIKDMGIQGLTRDEVESWMAEKQ
jgi:hypothetical protein